MNKMLRKLMLQTFNLSIIILLAKPSALNASFFNFWPFTNSLNPKVCSRDLRSAAEEFKKRYDEEVEERRKQSSESARLVREISKPQVSDYFTGSKPSVVLREASAQPFLTMIGAFQCSMLRKLEEQYDGIVSIGSSVSCVREIPEINADCKQYLLLNRINTINSRIYEFSLMERMGQQPKFSVRPDDRCLHKVVGEVKHGGSREHAGQTYCVSDIYWRKEVLD